MPLIRHYVSLPSLFSFINFNVSWLFLMAISLNRSRLQAIPIVPGYMDWSRITPFGGTVSLHRYSLRAVELTMQRSLHPHSSHFGFDEGERFKAQVPPHPGIG